MRIPLRNAEGNQVWATSVEELRTLTAQGYGGIRDSDGIRNGFYQMGDTAFHANSVDELLNAFERGASFATSDAARRALQRERVDAQQEVSEQFGDLAVIDPFVQAGSFGLVGIAQEALSPGVRETQRTINQANPGLYAAGTAASFLPSVIPGAGATSIAARTLPGAARNVLSAGVRSAGNAGLGRVVGEGIRRGGQPGLARHLLASTAEAGVDSVGATLTHMINGDRELAADAVLANGGLGAAIGFGAELGMQGLGRGLGALASLANRTGRRVLARRPGQDLIDNNVAAAGVHNAVANATDQEIAALMAASARQQLQLPSRVPLPDAVPNPQPARIDDFLRQADDPNVPTPYLRDGYEATVYGPDMFVLRKTGPNGTEGSLSVRVRDGRVLIDDIEVTNRRQGIGTALMEQLSEIAGGWGNVVHGQVTRDGAALKRAMDVRMGSVGPGGRSIGGGARVIPTVDTAIGPASPLVPSIAPPQVKQRIARSVGPVQEAYNNFTSLIGQGRKADLDTMAAAGVRRIARAEEDVAQIARRQEEALNQVIDTVDNLQAIRADIGRGTRPAVLDTLGENGLALGARAIQDQLPTLRRSLAEAISRPGAIQNPGVLRSFGPTLDNLLQRMEAGVTGEDLFFDVAEAYSAMRNKVANLSEPQLRLEGNTAAMDVVNSLGQVVENAYGESGKRLGEFFAGLDQYALAMDKLRPFTRSVGRGRRTFDAGQIERAMANASEAPEQIQEAIAEAFRGAERAAAVAGDFGQKLNVDVGGIANKVLGEFEDNLEAIRVLQATRRQSAHEYRATASNFTGGALGAAVGGLFGGPVGLVGGATAGMALQAAMRPGMMYQKAGLIANAYEQVARGVAPRVQGLVQHIQKVAGGAARGATRARRAAPGLVVALNSPDDVETQYRGAQERLRELASNGEALQARIEAATGGVGQIDPELGQIMGMRIAQAVQYLNSVFPEDRRDPLRPNQPGPLPSRTEMGIAIRRLEIVEDPLSLVDKLTDGSLTVAEADTVRAVYPILYQEIATQVAAALTEYKGSIPFQTRTSLSTFLGVDSSRLLTGPALFHLQSRFAQTGPQQRQINPPRRPLSRNISESSITVTQRLTQ